MRVRWVTSRTSTLSAGKMYLSKRSASGARIEGLVSKRTLFWLMSAVARSRQRAVAVTKTVSAPAPGARRKKSAVLWLCKKERRSAPLSERRPQWLRSCSAAPPRSAATTASALLNVCGTMCVVVVASSSCLLCVCFF